MPVKDELSEGCNTHMPLQAAYKVTNMKPVKVMFHANSIFEKQYLPEKGTCKDSQPTLHVFNVLVGGILARQLKYQTTRMTRLGSN